jgi:hypothetical protein
MPMPEVSTPQFRTLLIRKLGNLYPEYKVEISKQDDAGIQFRLLNQAEQPVTRHCTIHRTTPNTLTKTSLDRTILMLDTANGDSNQ